MHYTVAFNLLYIIIISLSLSLSYRLADKNYLYKTIYYKTDV